MENYKFNAVTRTLVMSAAFAKAVSDTRTPEYKLYRRMLSEVPNLTVERKTHASPKSYKGKDGKRTTSNPAKNLTYERMEKFMRALPNGGEKYMNEYNTLRAVCSVSSSPYAIVRKWFEAQFPDYRKNPLFYIRNDVEVIDFSTFLKEEKGA